jgi:hypothetical protein
MNPGRRCPPAGDKGSFGCIRLNAVSYKIQIKKGQNENGNKKESSVFFSGQIKRGGKNC